MRFFWPNMLGAMTILRNWPNAVMLAKLGDCSFLVLETLQHWGGPKNVLAARVYCTDLCADLHTGSRAKGVKVKLKKQIH